MYTTIRRHVVDHDGLSGALRIRKLDYTTLICMSLIVCTLIFTHVFGALAVIIPLVYGICGEQIYSRSNWCFYQPFKGGWRFVLLNGLAWSFYALSIFMTLFSSLSYNLDPILFQKISGSMIVAALLVFKGDGDMNESSKAKLMIKNKTFAQAALQNVMMIESSGIVPTSIWWLFLGTQMETSFSAMLALLAPNASYEILPVMVWMISVSCLLTHTLGGQWLHLDQGYVSIQFGKGGFKYIIMQLIGWLSFSFSILFALLLLMSDASYVHVLQTGTDNQIRLIGILGFLAQVLISLSLFCYEKTPRIPENENMRRPNQSYFMKLLINTGFLGMNLLFRPKNIAVRAIEIQTPTDYKKGDERFNELSKDCKKTGDQYLVIGVGFVGTHLVRALLNRGEDRIRLFDISPVNPFLGDSRVEFVRGDVTNAADILKACEGVDCVYSTFAILRFMDRLDHQAYLSYKINVGGTKAVLEACKKANVKYIIVTSSSNATTDEHSEPRFMRDETSPYVTRETSHNHYGWTKALADDICLKANGSRTANGCTLKVSIIRPCSAVFGADDRVTFQQGMEMGIFPGVAPETVVDWVHVQNVVLGHVLLEQKLREEALGLVTGISGEAFNISNNDAYTFASFWETVEKIAQEMPDSVAKSHLHVMYVPMTPIWLCAYFSELIQYLFQGRVSLGRKLDMLTPASLITAHMSYSYNIDKARSKLGYEPAYTVQESIQKSLIEFWKSMEEAAQKTKNKKS